MFETGFDLMAIHRTVNIHVARHPCVVIDFSCSSRWSSNADNFDPQVVYAHWACPCGAASRAREIPTSKDERVPRPGRSERHPEGVGGLGLGEPVRTQKVNVTDSNFAKTAC